MNLPETVHDIDIVRARIEPYTWDFAQERRADINAFWQNLVAGKPKMFNGRVLLQHRGVIRDGVFDAGYFETGYAAFLAWQRFGCPAPAMRNGFAMAALRANDGAFLLGEMGAHTANAGKIYFAAGTPDLNDVRPDGTVDLAGSVVRELQEETGLTADEYQAGTNWTVVLSAVRAAFMRPVGIDLPAEAARDLIRARLARQSDPELADIVIIRSAAECTQERMPSFMRTYLRHAFAA